MTFRQSNSSCNDKYSKPKSRLNQQIRRDSIDEGCPVLEKSGAICGETDNFDVFQQFRNIYEDCIKKLKGSEDGNSTLQKLAPFKKLIDDLWEQNAMLVETVEELEQEATCRVTDLQDKLNKSCQKMCEFEEDIKSLVDIIQSLCKNGVYNPAELKLNTLCPASIFGGCKKSCGKENQRNETGCDICLNLKSLKKPLYCISEEPEEQGCDVSETDSDLSLLSNCSGKNIRCSLENNALNENCIDLNPEDEDEIEDENENEIENEDEDDCHCHCQECVQPMNFKCNINNYSISIRNVDRCCCEGLCMVPEADEQ